MYTVYQQRPVGGPHFYRSKVAWNEKENIQIFLFQKYGKVWSVSKKLFGSESTSYTSPSLEFLMEW